MLKPTLVVRAMNEVDGKWECVGGKFHFQVFQLWNLGKIFIKFCTVDCVADAIIAHANILNQSAQRDVSAARHRVYEVVISDIFRR